jgi:hypothetical protein
MSLSGASHGSTQECRSSRADRFDAVYLRAAQAYMLISMPTGTSIILGAFQVIPFSHEIWREFRAEAEPRITPRITQVRKIESRTAADQTRRSIFLSQAKRFLF